MWLISGIRLPVITFMVTLLCLCIVLLSLFVDIRDKNRMSDERLGFDRQTAGTIESKSRDDYNYYVKFSFEYIGPDNALKTEERSVRVDQETYDSLALDGRVNILYSSKMARVSNIENNKYNDVVQKRIIGDLLLVCIFVFSSVVSALYFLYFKKNIETRNT
jgi:hypothetical protein